MLIILEGQVGLVLDSFVRSQEEFTGMESFMGFSLDNQ